MDTVVAERYTGGFDSLTLYAVFGLIRIPKIYIHDVVIFIPELSEHAFH